MESQKEEREKHMNFYPFFRTKDVVTYVLEGKDLKPYNFSKNSIIHKFSRKIIKLDKGPHFGFKSIFCRIPNQKKKYRPKPI